MVPPLPLTRMITSPERSAPLFSRVTQMGAHSPYLKLPSKAASVCRSSPGVVVWALAGVRTLKSSVRLSRVERRMWVCFDCMHFSCRMIATKDKEFLATKDTKVHEIFLATN